MSYDRKILVKLVDSLKKYDAIALVGPRQSGKTTLSKMCAPNFKYVSLENPDTRFIAINDPRLFLESCIGNTILDEVQNTPELFSYLQEILDDESDQRKFILTSSNSFKLNEKISQSLAGRIRIFNILPLTMEELPKDKFPKSIDELLVTGLYPRIYFKDLDANEWFADYYQTYLQKDVRQLINISDLNQFDRFVRLCAGRVAQLSEYSSIAGEVGISQPTAVRWSSLLETSFITFRLAPYFKSFNKKITKSPKIYFYDTGLLCQLLQIRSAEMLMTHPMRGEIFENFLIAEVAKYFMSIGEIPSIYFWRDKYGHEVDLLLDLGTKLKCFEIKSGKTFQDDWCKQLFWFKEISQSEDLNLIYGGDNDFKYKNVKVSNWRNLIENIHKTLAKEEFANLT